MRGLDLGSVSCLLETLTRLEEVLRQIGLANIHAEPLDQTAAFDDRPARLPEGAPLSRTGLDDACRKAQSAPLWLDLAHDLSVQPVRRADIRAVTEFGCGLLLKSRQASATAQPAQHRHGEGDPSGVAAPLAGRDRCR
jgi:hypothetical protein